MGNNQNNEGSNDSRGLYSLSQADIDSVYKTIFQKFSANHPSLKFPRFVILGAQPGAGKSVLSRKLKREFERAAQPVHVDIDALREFHPHAERILQEDPLNFGSHTHVDSGIWTAYLLRDAKMSKNSILYEVSLRSSEWSKSEIEAFKAEGYAVDMHVMAVNEHVSRMSIFQRFENAIAAGRQPRYVPIGFHDHVYQVLPSNVDKLEQSCEFDLVAVHNRQGNRLYERVNQSGLPQASTAVLLERERAWTNDEKVKHMTSWASVVKRAIDRPSGLLKTEEYINTLVESMRLAASFTQIQSSDGWVRELGGHTIPGLRLNS